jgi:Flp pilus assembly protein TadG
VTERCPQHRRDRGAAAVEFALVVPVLLLLVLGIAEFGRAYNIQTTLSGAAREGVRSMAVQNDPGAARAAAQRAAASLPLGDGDISISPASCPVGSEAPAATATVTITYRMAFVTSLFAPAITLSGTGVMRCGG